MRSQWPGCTHQPRRLLTLSENWLETVLAFEVIFCAKMGVTATRHRGIMAELVEAILEKDNDIDKNLARTMARTLIWTCLCRPNRRLTEEAAGRCVRQQSNTRQRGRVFLAACGLLVPPLPPLPRFSACADGDKPPGHVCFVLLDFSSFGLLLRLLQSSGMCDLEEVLI